MDARSKNIARALAAAAVLLVAPAAFADATAAPASDVGAGVCRERPSLPASVEALARLQARLQAEAAAAGEDAPIVLNGRGYNYASQRDPVRELQILDAERARAARPHP
ncbi:MAG TPA: hypothetical protein VHQ66_12120 [Myxococcota bacterium]|jgi:hypothetical protein|nr:hypothetical protein [Myxococcota bacterium]